jgi:hypothetical protein
MSSKLIEINSIDPVFDAQVNLLTSTTGFEPKFKMYGGTKVSNLALQYVSHFIFSAYGRGQDIVPDHSIYLTLNLEIYKLV